SRLCARLHSARRTTNDRTAARRKLDRRRDDPCAGGLRKRAWAVGFIDWLGLECVMNRSPVVQVACELSRRITVRTQRTRQMFFMTETSCLPTAFVLGDPHVTLKRVALAVHRCEQVENRRRWNNDEIHLLLVEWVEDKNPELCSGLRDLLPLERKPATRLEAG